MKNISSQNLDAKSERVSLDQREDNEKKERPTVTVIIPTLNEAKNLPLIIPFMPMNWIDEVILVDGRSTDNTVEVAKELLPSIKVVLETRKGKGIAMRAGYEAATGDILIVMDADGSNDPREIPRFISALMVGADFAKGSRFAPGGGTTDMPRYRKMGNGVFVLLSNLLFDLKFTDLAYGYHAFWKYCLDVIDLDSYDGFEIDTALYLQAARLDLRIVEVPSFEGFRFYGVGKLQTIPDGWRVLKTIFYQWFKSFRKNEKKDHIGFRGIKFAHSSGFESLDTLNSERHFSERMVEFTRLMSIMIFSGNDPQSAMKKILKQALDTVGTSSGSLILIDENGQVIDGCLAGEAGFLKTEGVEWSDVLENGLAGWAIKNRQPVLVLDTKEDDRWLQREWDVDRHSALIMPLSIGGMVIGALTLVRSDKDQFTEEDLNSLENITTK